MFLKNFEFATPILDSDLYNYLRRFDRDGDNALDYGDFVSSLTPKTNYSVKAYIAEKAEVAPSE